MAGSRTSSIHIKHLQIARIQQQSQPKYNQWFLRAPVELHRNQPAEDVNNQKTTFEMSHVK